MVRRGSTVRVRQRASLSADMPARLPSRHSVRLLLDVTGQRSNGQRFQPDLKGRVMTSIKCVHLEQPEPTVVEAFYLDAFGLGDPVRLRASEAPSTGFLGFTLSLLVSQPATVDAFTRAALDAGATSLKPAAKQFW